MIYKLVTNVLGVLLALVTLDLAAAPSSVGMVYTVNSPVPLLLKWVPGGQFRMGDLAGVGQADEQPVRTVTVPGFWMMKTEVTVAMFHRYVADTGIEIPQGCGYFDDGWKLDQGISWEAPGFTQASDHPVTCVSWQDAVAFSQWLSGETGLAFSLPSEAQWEYAARAGTLSVFVHGNNPGGLCAHANGADRRALEDYPGFDVNDCDDGYTRTAPVASYSPNALGLHDMTGNVWEWTADCWPADYAISGRDGSVFSGGDCERRGYRGGAYGDVPFFLRVSLRNRGFPDERRDDVGFRLVLNDW